MHGEDKLTEVQKAFEEVNLRNMNAVIDYSKETRKIVRDLSNQVDQLKNLVMQQNQTIEQLKTTLTKLLVEKYTGKATK